MSLGSSRLYTNNGGIIGPDNDPAVNPETITTATSSGTYSPAGATTAEIVLVGGGGGGGSNRGGAGGAGGVLHASSYTLPGSPVSFTIGGPGSQAGGNTKGNNGGSSSFDGHTADGGGG